MAVAMGLGAVLVLLGALELAVRLWGSGRYEPYSMEHAPRSDPMFVHDPDLFWRARPSFKGEGHPFTTNALGLRDAEFPAPGGGRRFAVLCLGDSSTWGDGVGDDEMYPVLLERALQRLARGARVDVLNAGVPGYSSLQSLAFQRKLMARFTFHVVLIAALNSDMMLARQPDRVYVLSGASEQVFRLAYASELFRFTRSWLTSVTEVRVDYSTSFVPRVPASPDYGRLLARMVALARQRGARVVFVEPFMVCRHAHCKKLEQAMGPLSPAMEAMADRMEKLAPRYHAVMRAVAQKQKVVLANMPAAMAKQARPWTLYADSIHPNAAGHRLMARILTDRVAPMLP